MLRHRLLCLSIAVVWLGGCVGRPRSPGGYYGPTASMDEVVLRINQNNKAIPTLYAKQYIEANVVDPKTKKATFINTGGDLFVRKPRELLLRGKKDVAGQVFELGSTQERYWLTVLAGEDTQWWGWHRNAGKECAKGMPIRPDLIGEVLGIGQVNADFNQVPAPTMRFNNDLDVYMLVWSARLPDRWYAEKEIWYDRATLRPRKVLLFDRDGRIVLRANLGQHQQVAIAGEPKEQWPWIATWYDLFFPESKSALTMKLSEPALTTRTGNPKEGMIRFPEDAGTSKVIQIDEAYEK